MPVRDRGRAGGGRLLALVLCAALAQACTAGTARSPSAVRSSPPASAATTPAPAPAAPPPPPPPPRKYAAPASLEVPSAGIDCKVVPVGTTSDGVMAVTKPSMIADWLQTGPHPGEQGSAVIAGHSGYARSAAAFDPLPRVRVGDPVYVRGTDGSRVAFKVIEKKLYPADASAPEVFGRSDGRYLNLVTCTGSWNAGAGTHSERLVVFTRLAD